MSSENLREAIARLVYRAWFTSALYEFNTAGGEIQQVCYQCADKILSRLKSRIEQMVNPHNEDSRYEDEGLRALGYEECLKDILSKLQ